MVQHEDGAEPREHRSQQMMRAGMIQRCQSGANEVAAKLLHSGGWPVRVRLQNYRKSAEETVIRTSVRRSDNCRVISSLTVSQGFVFTLFPLPPI
jgi:hypothetical protein